MLRRSFLKRMALAAAACAFIDVPWPKERTVEMRAVLPADGAWYVDLDGVRFWPEASRIAASSGEMAAIQPLPNGYYRLVVSRTDGLMSSAAVKVPARPFPFDLPREEIMMGPMRIGVPSPSYVADMKVVQTKVAPGIRTMDEMRALAGRTQA